VDYMWGWSGRPGGEFTVSGAYRVFAGLQPHPHTRIFTEQAGIADVPAHHVFGLLASLLTSSCT
jgi:hypothetical protein